MTKWQYTRIVASASRDMPRTGDSAAVDQEAMKSWLDQLNQRGAEGWELVSESFTTGGSDTGMSSVWAQFVGTLKRPMTTPPPG